MKCRSVKGDNSFFPNSKSDNVMKIVNLHVFDAFQKLFTFIFEKKSLITLSRYQYNFIEMMKKYCTIYRKKIKYTL